MFETFMTIKGADGVRVVNCFDCGGSLHGGPLVAGVVRECVDCGAAWKLRAR